MTVQIDSPAINTADARIDEVPVDQLNEQVAALDADILGAVERRTELARRLAREWVGYTFDPESASAGKLNVLSEYEGC